MPGRDTSDDYWKRLSVAEAARRDGSGGMLPSAEAWEVMCTRLDMPSWVDDPRRRFETWWTQDLSGSTGRGERVVAVVQIQDLPHPDDTAICAYFAARAAAVASAEALARSILEPINPAGTSLDSIVWKALGAHAYDRYVTRPHPFASADMRALHAEIEPMGFTFVYTYGERIVLAAKIPGYVARPERSVQISPPAFNGATVVVKDQTGDAAVDPIIVFPGTMGCTINSSSYHAIERDYGILSLIGESGRWLSF